MSFLFKPNHLRRDETAPPTISILVVGMPNVGKTSLVRRFAENKFDDTKKIETADIDTTTKWGQVVTVRKDALGQNLPRAIEFIIDDCAGGETLRKTCKNYDGFIVVYAKDQKDTFKISVDMIASIFHIKKWVVGKNQLKARPIFPCILVQSKSDLEGITKFTFESVCNDYNIKHYITSAKTGLCVTDTFTSLAQMIYDKHVGVVNRMNTNRISDDVVKFKTARSSVDLLRNSADFEKKSADFKRRSIDFERHSMEIPTKPFEGWADKPVDSPIKIIEEILEETKVIPDTKTRKEKWRKSKSLNNIPKDPKEKKCIVM